MDRRALTRKVLIVDKILAEMYGEKKQERFMEPTDELILTVLSQNTNDINRDRAFTALREKFPTWQDAAGASTTSIASAIKIGGLANIKSKRIKKILKQIGEKSDDYTISFIKKMPDEKAWEYLVAFDGVGPKTASCVMMFSLGKDTMPVDTHVHRLSKRLGLIANSVNADQAHDWYREMSFPVSAYQFHLNLIQHGRTLCRAKSPQCFECRLKKQCSYYNENKV